MDFIKTAFETIKKHPVPWILLGLVFGMIQPFGGAFLMPNFIRIARKASSSDEAPDIGDLFKFDDIMDDLVTMVILSVAVILGICGCIIGAWIVAILGTWTLHLRADKLYAPVDCLKASLHHVKSNVVDVFVGNLIIQVVIMLGVVFTCGLGAIVATPIMVIAMERFYASNRDAIIAAGDAAGIPRLV
jgi:hypothetical protein